ncbi:hypothetical protein [Parafrankia sp. EUN1f]|uniref:hypothetical protein n=1 Tax=Parafrankia sp. EUN1f TaxID=102897 RepID=UPI0001C45579|nr:hypothetical protein [Parafrankia sp. EUN1f]EFC86464.1 hypothetical protein FrEUN1fDRAFT_0359 [Parafrankia sp. EUN1f]
MIRTAVGAVTTHQVTFWGDEDPVDPDGNTATLTITDVDGAASTSTGIRASTGVYTALLPTSVDPTIYRLRWSGTFTGIEQVITDAVEVTGARLFTLADLRATDSAFGDRDRYPTALLETVRRETEDEAERIMSRSFIPRYREIVTTGGQITQLLWLDCLPVQRILSATVDGTPVDVQTIAADALGYVANYSGWSTEFLGNTIRLVYGETDVPSDVRRAALIRARTRLLDFNSGIPDRATSFSAVEGGTYSLATPGRAGFETGVPEVDAVYKRHSYTIGIF